MRYKPIPSYHKQLVADYYKVLIDLYGFDIFHRHIKLIKRIIWEGSKLKSKTLKMLEKRFELD